jgi:hypothetical protein
MSLKIYSAPEYLPPGLGHVVMLYPFWGKNPEDPADPSSGRYDRYTAMGREWFELTSLGQAHLAVLPAPWERVRGNSAAESLARRFLAEVREAGKPALIFFWDDSPQPVDAADALVLRTSFYRSRRRPGEFAQPAWSEDLAARYFNGRLPRRPKSTRPVVGFCGFGQVRWTLKNLLYWGASRLGLREPGAFTGHRLRARALRLLGESPLVETNFIIRDAFFGGALTPAGGMAQVQALRREFVDNLAASDYVLCVRGNGNFSYRLYEALSLGRIPVLVDTDCPLPYDWDIDWRRYCVWVDQKDLGGIARQVAEFHDRLTPAEFEDLQRQCRALWEARLSPEGFFQHFHRHLEVWT